MISDLLPFLLEFILGNMLQACFRLAGFLFGFDLSRVKECELKVSQGL